jgi:hypothetical protein
MVLHDLSPNKGQTGLDQFGFGNVGPGHSYRHAADAGVIVVLIREFTLLILYPRFGVADNSVVWTFFMLHHEYSAFARIRQAYLNSPAHAALPRSRTIMINNLPKKWMSEERVRELISFVEGPVEMVWLPRKVKDMEKIFDKRNKECGKLEAAEAKAESMAVKNIKKNKVPPVDGATTERADPIDRYILPKKRPTHRTGLLGLFGKKVDTLEYSPAFIREQDEKLAAERARLDDCPLLTTAFVRFARQADAHQCALNIKRQPGAKLVSAAIDVMPEDVIWSNLAMSAVQRKLRTFISWAITLFIIGTFVIYVAFVGSVSKISTVCAKLKFLKWICGLNPVVVGLIQGVLPPALLAVLFMLVPIIFRKLLALQGEPRHSDLERKLWYRYWAFLLFDGFLVVSAASGFLPILSKLTSGGGIEDFVKGLPTQLATNLPTASTFCMVSSFLLGISC